MCFQVHSVTELKSSNLETPGSGVGHWTSQHAAAALGPDSLADSATDSAYAQQGVMTLEAAIPPESLRILDMTSCEGCRQFFCRPLSPTDEQSIAIAALSSHDISFPGSIMIIIDSGATRHMVPWRWLFTSIREAVQGKVVLGSKSYSLRIEGVGKTGLTCLNNVLWVPELSMGLLSVTQLDREGCSSTFHNKECIVTHRASGEVVLRASLHGNLYKVDREYMSVLDSVATEEVEEQAMVAEEDARLRGSAQPRLTQMTDGLGGLDILHRRLGHISETKIKKGLRNNNWEGSQYSYQELKNQRLRFCPACFEGQMKSFARPPTSEKEVEPGVKFGVDYKGKFSVTSVDGYDGFYLFADYGSNHLMLFLVKSKGADATKQVLEEFYHRMKLLTKKPATTMQCDYDTVLRSSEVTSWLRDKGIKLQMSAPYTHWQNGKIERSMGKVMDTARTLMADGRVPKRFWSWAVRTAVYQLNRQPVYNSDKTPHEAATGEVPDISAMVPFWSIGVYHKTKEERRGPWDYKAVLVRMLGYSSTSKNTYVVYEIGTSNVIKERHDCIWDERLLVEEEHVTPENLEGDMDDDDLAAVEEELRSDGHLGNLDSVDSEAGYDREGEEKYWQEVGDGPYWALLTEVEEWIDDAQALAAKVKAAELEPIRQPSDWDECMNGPERDQWLEAFNTEVGNFGSRATFEQAAQVGHAMKTKLIFKKTRRPDGTFKYKVRLVAKGFTQIKGVNYNETYAPTTSTSVVLVVLQLAIILRMDLSSFDVTAAFLEGKNDYPNYAWLPKGFGPLGGQRVKVVGNFYGEKQGPKIWNDRLNEILLSGEFERCPVHPCLYLKREDKGTMFMCVHVDDGLAATDTIDLKAKFKTHLLSEVQQATFDDNVRKYIGIDVSVTSDSRGRRVKLTHEQYINDSFGDFADSASVDIPMCPSHNLRTAAPVVRDLTMLPDTGKFRFACDRGRPDILVATGEIATGGDKNPSLLHEAVAARTKQYLYHTRTLGIELGEGELEIFGYSDAAYITHGNCKSRLGGCIFLNRHSGAVRSFSKTDTQVSSLSHSSTEAEIKAMDEWVREVLHIVDIVSFLIGRRYSQPVKLFVDNQAAIVLCTTLKQSHKVKHINLRINFIREQYDEGFLTIHHVAGEDNTADMLTKPLAKEVFTKHRETLMTGHRGALPKHSTL